METGKLFSSQKQTKEVNQVHSTTAYTMEVIDARTIEV